MTLRPTVEHARADDYRRPGGPWDVPTLDQCLRAATGARERLLDLATGRRLDVDALEHEVAVVAGGLRERGVRRGDVVAWQLPNSAEAVVLFRACWRLGAIAAPVHDRAGPSDRHDVLDAVSPAVVLLDRHELPRGEPVTGSEATPADLAVVLFTSGSSGGPKAALHTQRGLAYKGRRMADVHGLTPDDVVLMPAPLAHVSGLLNAVLIPGVVPMRTVLMDRWDPEVALDTIEREHVTFMIGPPTFFVMLTAAAGFAPERVADLRLVSSGGAGVTTAFVERMRAELGAQVKRTYGSTEAPTVTTSRPGDPPDRAARTDGRSTGDVELRIVDPSTGADVAAGGEGELWLRGPELFVGYADAERNASSFAEGWFRTGDLATLDDTGWLTIVGRLHDVIIRGGENISATEVEGILESHPAVAHAVVVGEPDERLGERVAAFVVADDDFDLAVCRDWFERRGVARYETPERVERLDEIPTLAAGKPDRGALRDRLSGRPGESSE